MNKQKKTIKRQVQGIMKVDFEYFTNLQYKVKSLTAKVKAFESGEAYITLRQTFEKLLRAKDREIRAGSHLCQSP